jgi:hypothetical protein
MSERHPYGTSDHAYQPAPGPPADGQQPPGYPQPLPQRTNTMAILALVFAFVFSPLGIVFGAIGLGQIKRRPESGRGLALSGVILGSIFTAIPIVVLIVLVVAVNTGGQTVSAGTSPSADGHASPPAASSPTAALTAHSPSDIAGLQTYQYAAGQPHVTTRVQYQQSPPVGGPHDPYWADCAGAVYSVDIRHENAVHSLEHGAVWITYNPQKVSAADIATLATLVTDQPGRMMSPYAGQGSPISIQSWNHQLSAAKAADPRIAEFADFFTTNAEYYPEVGASCENPDFKARPLLAGQPSTAIGSSDGPTR